MNNLIGQTIDRYHILEQIGEGGMAVVYKAYDTNLERFVAIKILRTVLVSSKTILKRFHREGKALAGLSHPNIIQVLDYGTHDGIPYIVMEYVDGGTLKQLMNGPMPVNEVVQILLPIADALQFAHNKGIIHRDIKPSNILISKEGKPMLSDFGIAKMLENDETIELTTVGVGVGTPEYMAPEQGLGSSVTQRADIYSLGIVFFEMVTGRKPYQADTPLAVLYKQINEALPKARELNNTLSEDVEKILIKVLAKKPENRYASMNAFSEALKNLQSGKQKSPNRVIYTLMIAAIILVFLLILKFQGLIPRFNLDKIITIGGTTTSTQQDIQVITPTSTAAKSIVESTGKMLPTATVMKKVTNTPQLSTAEWDVINHNEYYSIKKEFDSSKFDWIQINLLFNGGKINSSNGSASIGSDRKLQERLFMIHLIQDFGNQKFKLSGPEGSNIKNRTAENDYSYKNTVTYYIRDTSSPSIVPGFYSGIIGGETFDFEVLSIPSRYLIILPRLVLNEEGIITAIETDWYSLNKEDVFPISSQVVSTLVDRYSYSIYGVGKPCESNYPNVGEILRVDADLPQENINISCPIQIKNVTKIMGAYEASDGGYFIYTFKK